LFYIERLTVELSNFEIGYWNICWENWLENFMEFSSFQNFIVLDDDGNYIILDMGRGSSLHLEFWRFSQRKKISRKKILENLKNNSTHKRFEGNLLAIVILIPFSNKNFSKTHNKLLVIIHPFQYLLFPQFFYTFFSA
jgi:hypothetical protein